MAFAGASYLMMRATLLLAAVLLFPDSAGKPRTVSPIPFDVYSGRPLWKDGADDDWYSMSSGEVYVRKGLVVSRLDARVGGQTWDARLPDIPWAQLADEGHTAICFRDRVLCLKGSTGRALWEVALPSGQTRGMIGAWPVP